MNAPSALLFILFAFVLPVATAIYSFMMIQRYRQLDPALRRYLEAAIDVPAGGGHLILGVGGGYILADMMGVPFMFIAYCGWGALCHAAIGPIYRLEAHEKARAVAEFEGRGDASITIDVTPAPLAGTPGNPEARP